MSSINPNNIDGQYPIAGQDNDSQGFRDNFTNIKRNLTFAKTEIEAIEQRAILKTALPGIALNNDMTNGQIKGAQLLRATETIKDLAEIGTTVNWTEGHFQYFTLTENTILSLTGWPTSGFYTKLRLQVEVSDISYTLTLPTTVPLANANSIQGCTARVITFPATGTYLFEFSTYNNGTTVTVQDLLRNYDVSLGATSFTDITVSSAANITGNTASTSTTTGALKVAGGAGIQGNLNVGGDVTINGTIVQNGINYEEYEITVADNGSGTQTVFYLKDAGSEANAVPLISNTGATFGLTFIPGYTYKFDLSDPSNALVPLKFSTTPDTAVPASITPYTTGVTNSTVLAGNAGAYTQITITNEAPTTLYLYADDSDAIIDTSLIGGALPIAVVSPTFTGSEDLASAGNVSLTKTVSYFTTGASPETATLTAGSVGQIKTFAMYGDGGGDMVITVSNPGWSANATSTLTFNDIGDACTMQYIVNKWFVIGNNGVTLGT
jgi:hypothetical protein